MSINYGKVRNRINQGLAIANALGIRSARRTVSAIDNAPRVIVDRQQAARNTAAVRIYPGDLANHYILFNFKEFDYERNSNPKRGSDGRLTIPKAHIALPIPKEFVQDYKVGYRDSQIGGLTGEVLNVNEAREASGGSVLQGLITYANPGGTAPDYGGLDMLKDIRDISTVGARATLRKNLPGFVRDAISVATGYAENPNDRAVLDNVPLRTHSFSWTFAPRNNAEHEVLKDIINIFRRQMFPKRAGLPSSDTMASYLFKYPSVVDIYVDNFKHDFFYKTSAVTNFKVDMSQDGSPVFLQGDEGPAIYNITLEVKELESLEAEDFAQVDLGD